MDRAKRKRLLGNGMLVLASLIWGLAFAVQRIGAASVPPAAFTSLRMALAALSVGLALVLRREIRQRVGGKTEAAGVLGETLRGGAACGCFLAAACTLQQMGLATTTAGKAGFLTAMYILFVPAAQALLFGKRILPRVWLAVALGLAGMYLLCVSEGFRLARGDALVLACACMYCGHILCCGHFSRRADPLALAALQFLTCAALTGCFSLARERVDPAAIWQAAPEILYCGVLSGGVGYTLQMEAQAFTDPAAASLLMSLESVFAAVSGALLLGERMGPRELAGSLVLFLAIVLVQLPEKRG